MSVKIEKLNLTLNIETNKYVKKIWSPVIRMFKKNKKWMDGVIETSQSGSGEKPLGAQRGVTMINSRNVNTLNNLGGRCCPPLFDPGGPHFSSCSSSTPTPPFRDFAFSKSVPCWAASLGSCPPIWMLSN